MIENEMGNRGSKSTFLNAVKEQRVDGSYFGSLIYPKLRYTLMAFERKYQIKIPSKQLNISSFSTLNYNSFSCDGNTEPANNSSKLNPWWITGFTDAEGSFQIILRYDTRLKINWRVGPAFQIKLHIKDIAILEEIKNTLGVGTITKDRLNTANFNVWSVKELQVIIDHFDKYPLVTAKHSDFVLFKKCFEIVKNHEHLTEEGLLKILGLKSFLNLGLSNKLKEAFPNIVPISRPEYIFKGIPNPWWISGFVNGDGSFHLHVSKKNSKVSTNVHRKVFLSFVICLHSRDEKVLLSLVDYFKSLEIKVNRAAPATVCDPSQREQGLVLK